MAVWTAGDSARHTLLMLFFVALLTGWLTGVPSWAGAVQEVRVQGDYVTVKFSKPVQQATLFMLSAPGARSDRRGPARRDVQRCGSAPFPERVSP